MNVSFRTAGADDLPWVHAQYEAADFLPPSAGHRVLIAEVGGERAGLGRLVPAGPGAVELGGIFVLPRFRGSGLARRIVEALIRDSGAAAVWCIPYARLAPMYERCGFRAAGEDAEVPPEVLDKLAYCRRHYAEPVRLMRLEDAPAAG